MPLLLYRDAEDGTVNSFAQILFFDICCRFCPAQATARALHTLSQQATTYSTPSGNRKRQAVKRVQTPVVKAARPEATMVAAPEAKQIRTQETTAIRNQEVALRREAILKRQNQMRWQQQEIAAT